MPNEATGASLWSQSQNVQVGSDCNCHSAGGRFVLLYAHEQVNKHQQLPAASGGRVNNRLDDQKRDADIPKHIPDQLIPSGMSIVVHCVRCRVVHQF